MGHLTLVLGGTKSGKTGWAQKRAAEREKQTGKTILYLATAQGLDPGMEERIRHHRASRPDSWITVEEPYFVADVLDEAARDKGAVILDCLTLLATNIILMKGEAPDPKEAQEAVLAEVEAIISASRRIEPELIIVSNHVEEGLVSPTPLGGMFQDIAGLSHQLIARHADEVVYMIAGIANTLKGQR
ncbi:bifunctional adenosylcobinamide kinase/adenosylcobinamide-phosphate guanylyltransferase [Sediminispirochaeta bajacaliforniensis]|uniref:bifunctional adenosylcobinamide kinase/adenosylcobinamide-phosphate guanylyltransferase n=1 Tax=Sediminispirochaeta bajacaliforniensis TaxID=148 RepID=UPI00036F65CB|nr:bifunctional adenosylcobinamide kinase/adenosylcobinamide-phosphate guanylyltransferase [Sediminispirochaeta bajacaliforniensis]